MNGVNNVQLLGRITSDPQVNVLGNGTKAANFSVAVNKDYTDSQWQKQTTVTYIRCSSYGKAADIVESFWVKGKQLYVEGELRVKNTEDKTYVDVVTSKLLFTAKNNDMQPEATEALPPETVPTATVDSVVEDVTA